MMLLREVHPDVVYFPAADPNVDWSENNPDAAHRANVVSAGGARSDHIDQRALCFFSSDYVFDGKNGPYNESAPTAPLNVYGSHKLEVEMAALDAARR